MTIDRLLEWSVDRHADRVAVVTEAATRTFREIDQRANALAHVLIGLGAAKGDRVGVLIGNQIEYPEAEIAICKAGAVRVPMLISSSPAEIERYVDFSDAAIVIAGGDGLSALRKARDLPRLRERKLTVIAVGDAGGDDLVYEAVIAGAPRHRPRIALGEDGVYALRFTGGTTGLPKGVVMDHRCMTNVINNVLLNWEVGFDEVVCHFHPLSHAAGKIMYTWWMRGARQVILPAFRFEPRILLETIERERVTALFMIPTAINVLLDSGLVGKYDTSSLRRIIYGGAPMAARRITEALAAFGPVLTQIYGCSEAPNLLTSLSREDHVFSGPPPERLRSAGRRGYNVEVKVVGEDGGECPPGVVGEVVSRGPHTMREYWKDPDLTAQRVVDGWVHTGDMARWDDEGYLYVIDRKDDVIITGGFNVWPAEVENALCSHASVAEAVVFGLADEKWGEAVTAVVVAKPGAAIGEGSLAEHLAPLLPRHKIPKRIVVRTEPLPKSAVGKVLRRRAREQYI